MVWIYFFVFKCLNFGRSSVVKHRSLCRASVSVLMVWLFVLPSLPVITMLLAMFNLAHNSVYCMQRHISASTAASSPSIHIYFMDFHLLIAYNDIVFVWYCWDLWYIVHWFNSWLKNLICLNENCQLHQSIKKDAFVFSIYQSVYIFPLQYHFLLFEDISLQTWSIWRKILIKLLCIEKRSWILEFKLHQKWLWISARIGQMFSGPDEMFLLHLFPGSKHQNDNRN